MWNTGQIFAINQGEQKNQELKYECKFKALCKKKLNLVKGVSKVTTN